MSQKETEIEMSEIDLGNGGEVQVELGEANVSSDVPLLHEEQNEKKPPSKSDEVPDDGTIVEEYSGATLSRLIMLAREEFWLILGGTIGLMISSASMLVIPHFAGKMIDVISMPVDDSNSTGDSTASRQAELKNTLIILLIWGLIGSMFAAVRSALFTIAGERLVARIRKQVYSSIVRQEIGFFDANRTGELMNRLASDPSTMKNAVTVNLSMSLRTLAQSTGSMIILFLISWKLTVLMMLVIPIISVTAVFYGKYVKRLAKEVQDALAKASEVAEESFSNIRTVRSFSQEPFEEKKYQERVQESYILGRTQAIALGCFIGTTGFFGYVGLVVVIWYGGVLVLEGEMSPGTLTEYMLYTIYLAVGFGTIAALYGDFMKALGASQRLFQLMDREPLVRFEGGKELESFKGCVEFRDVHFTYPARPDAPVLKGLSFNLEPGKVHALVGPSGGGKSTCIALMELFYYCQQGAVLIDGEDITELSPQWLRDHVGLVTQEPSLFACSVADNISYGIHGESSEADVEEMAKVANAHEFIAKMPDVYQTQVGEHGVRLSGGQKQRVAIARALLPSPSLLLLDEATSALDAESEHLVHEALDRLLHQKERTVLVIAHRLSTVKNADVVFVVEDGQVKQKGTHDELVVQNGTYRQLVLRQLQKDTLNGVEGEGGLKEEA